MDEIKAPKKERKFLRAIGDIGLALLRELVLGIGKKVINKIGNKRQGLVIAFALFASISYASIDSIPYPVTGNKQRLGFQTTGNGLVYRGRAADTITKPSSYIDKNVKAYLLLDSVRGTIFVWKQTFWDSIKVAGSSAIMPFDSITFNTAKDGTVGVGEVEYNDTQGSLIQGLKGGLVTNVIGQQLHQRVNNRTGATLTKGMAVYLSGSQGNKITVAKALAISDPTSANTFGIVAEQILNNASGYVMTEGLLININTSALTEDSAVYLSPTVAGGLTSTKPQAPFHSVYIGVCVKTNAGSGELFVKIRNGQELDELHDVRITSPVNKASLYYLSSEGVWRDTTAALLVSDTAAMLSNYASKAYADTSGRFYARQDYTTNVTTSTLTWSQTDTLVPGGVNVIMVYRNGQILLPSQYTVPTKTTVIIAATSFKVGENYTVIFPRGGGGGGSGSGSLTSISAGTGITVSPNPITTTGTVSADLTVLMELTDTSLLNLVSRFAVKLNATDTASLSSRINAKGTVTSIAMGYGISSTQSPLTTSGTMRVDSATVYDFVRDSIVAVEIGGDTIKIIKQEYNNVTSDTLTFTILPKFPIQLRQFILLFRNGQLLLNDQYTVIDTNKLKVAASSYKLGENYTLVTVSGIGSVGSAQGNPVYPDPGIALSTGTTWTTSVVNNSSNWNTAYTDRYKWDGGSTDLVAATGRTSLGGTTIGQSMFTLTNPSAVTFPRFNVDNTVTALSDVNFRSAIGAGTGNGNGTVTSVTASATSGNPLSINTTTTTPVIELLSATTARNGYLTSTDFTTFNNKFAFSDTTSLNLTSRFATKLNISDTASMLTNYNSRINLKLNISDTTNMLLPYFRDADTTSLNLTSRFATKQNTLTLTTTGTSGAATLTGATLNIPQYTGGAGSVTSVAMTVPTFLSVSGSPVTSNGTLGVTLSGSPLPVLNGGTGGANETDARNELGAACKSCNETLTGNKTYSGTVTLSSVAGTATSVIGRSSTGQVVGVTLGSGLSLASGTLSATGGSGTVTNVTGTLPISVATGTTTPVVSVANASTSAAGVVTTGTQSFAGSKTFTGLVGMQKALQRPVEYITVDGASITTSNTWVIVNYAGTVTLTFPSAALSTGTEYHIKTITANAVISASSNISPLAGGSASTSILPATAGKYVTLVSDGTNWVIMQSN